MLWCRSGLTSWWALALRGRSGSAWASLRPLMLGLWRCLTVRQRLALRLRGCRHLVLLRCRRGHRPGSGLTWGSSGWLIATTRLGHIGATGLAWNILPGSSRQGAHRYGGRGTNVVIGLQRLARDNNGWAPLVDLGKVAAVGFGGPRMLDLGCHGRRVLLPNRHDLRRPRSSLDAAPAAVVAHIVHDGGVVDDFVVVDVVDNRRIHVVDGPVVGEVVVVPVAALIPEANVAEAVVDAAVVADVATPISTVKTVPAAIIAPIRRCPQSALVRCIDPRAGDPIVALGSVVPIARGPDIVVTRRRRLLVLRQWGRGLGSVSYGLFRVVRITRGLVGWRVTGIARRTRIRWGRSRARSGLGSRRRCWRRSLT
jgi:hypothetical protein